MNGSNKPNPESLNTSERLVERFDRFDLTTQVLLILAIVILALGILILGVVYRGPIFAFLYCVAVVAVSGLIVIGLVLVISRKRKKKLELSHIENVRFGSKFRCNDEIINSILNGSVQPISDAGGLLLRNSETAWFRTNALILEKKIEEPHGLLVVTSLRVAFLSSASPVEIPVGNINAATVNGALLSIIGKTTSASANFSLRDAEIARAHVERVVKTYHRQVDVGFEPGASRAIPQDVKTAVYQRDGGKCIECQATDYLEFDHVIPWSKGGASTVDNIQLLCRRCNLRKGNSI